MVIGTKVGRTKHMRIMPGGALEQDEQGGGGSGGASSASAGKARKAGGPSSIFVGQKLGGPATRSGRGVGSRVPEASVRRGVEA